MRLLAINFGGLGDEVLFLPALSSIRASHPDWEITLLTEPRSRQIMGLTKLIDRNVLFDIKKVPLLPGDYLDLISLLRAGKYEIVISSGSSSKVALLLFLSGIPRRIGYDSGVLSRLLLSRAVKLNRDQYAAYMYHDLVRGLDIDTAAQTPRIDLDESALAAMQNLLDEQEAKSSGPRSRKRVLIHPGTSRLALEKGIIKTWAAENWCRLCLQLLALDCEVILCGGPDDDATISDITSKLGSRPADCGGLFINAYGKTGSIKDLAALMALSHLVICVDSAPMHIAAALEKRLIALFGPTDPAKLLVQTDKAVALKAGAIPAKAAPLPGIQIALEEVLELAEKQLKEPQP